MLLSAAEAYSVGRPHLLYGIVFCRMTLSGGVAYCVLYGCANAVLLTLFMHGYVIVYVILYVCIHAGMHACLFVCFFVYLFLYFFLCLFVCLCVCS